MVIYTRPCVLASIEMEEILVEAFGGSGSCEDSGHNSDGCHGVGNSSP